jgi:hypothetical protein
MNMGSYLIVSYLTYGGARAAMNAGPSDECQKWVKPQTGFLLLLVILAAAWDVNGFVLSRNCNSGYAILLMYSIRQVIRRHWQGGVKWLPYY